MLTDILESFAGKPNYIALVIFVDKLCRFYLSCQARNKALIINIIP